MLTKNKNAANFHARKEIAEMMSKEKYFITLTEAAELLGISRFTLSLWIKKDQEIKKNNIPEVIILKVNPLSIFNNICPDNTLAANLRPRDIFLVK